MRVTGAARFVIAVTLTGVTGCSRQPEPVSNPPSAPAKVGPRGIFLASVAAPRLDFPANHYGVTSTGVIFDLRTGETISTEARNATSGMFIEELAAAVRPLAAPAAATLSFDRGCSYRLLVDVLFTLGQAKSPVQVLAVRGGDKNSRGFVHAPPRGVSQGAGKSSAESSEAPKQKLSVKIRVDSVTLEDVQGSPRPTLCRTPSAGNVAIPHRNEEVHVDRIFGCARAYSGGAETAVIEGSQGVVFDDIARTMSALTGAGIEYFQFKLPRESRGTTPITPRTAPETTPDDTQSASNQSGPSARPK